MNIIGITGGIGTGKSSVLQYMKEKEQAYVVEADKLAHELMQPGKIAYNRIVEHFGEAILDENQVIDRKKLRDVVLQDEKKLTKLNHIVHPAVKEEIRRQIHEKQQKGCLLFVIEAALLLEDGYQEICNEIWMIETKKELRIKRLMESRGYDEETCERFMMNQADDTFYRERCDRIITNNESFSETEAQVRNLLKNM